MGNCPGAITRVEVIFLGGNCPDTLCQINQEILKASKNNSNIIRNEDFSTNVPIVGEGLLKAFYQGRYIRRITIFIFSFCIGLVTQLNGSALGVLKHYYITKRIRELLIGNWRSLIYNSLNQLLYYTI